LSKLDTLEQYNERLRKHNEKSKMMLKILSTYDLAKGNLSSFLNDIKKLSIASEIRSLDDETFKDQKRLLAVSKHSPSLQKHAYSQSYLEVIYRLSYCVNSGSCCGSYSKSFVDIDHVGDTYNYYPFCQYVNSCNSYITINGETINDNYQWTPTRTGEHVFEIEHIETTGLDIQKSYFEIKLEAN